jgi:methylmalonyl-CoA mutase
LEGDLDKKAFLEIYAAYLHQSQAAEMLPQIVGFCKAAHREADFIKTFGQAQENSLIATVLAKMPHFQSFVIEITAQQEWGLALSEGLVAYAEVLQVLRKEKLSPGQVLFSLPQIDNYFLAIALQISLRKLAAFIAAQLFDLPLEAAARMIKIHTYTQPSAQEADTHTNLIRNTTQAMSAILGGCDSLTVLPFEPPTAQRRTLAARLARNVSLILAEEAYFDKVNAPLAGSYFMENLIQKLSERVWMLFQASKATT